MAGRPPKYKTLAEKQAAYRKRRSGVKEVGGEEAEQVVMEESVPLSEIPAVPVVRVVAGSVWDVRDLEEAQKLISALRDELREAIPNANAQRWAIDRIKVKMGRES